MTLPSIGYRRAPLLASERELSLATAMAAMTALFAAAAVYGANSFAVGEIDVAWMIAGVVHGTLAHQPFTGALHYGSNFSFGYYALLYLLPPEVRADPASLARVVNAVGLISVTAALPLAWRYVARLMDERAAALAVTVFFFSPLVLQVAGSGHPLLLAFALCLAAALIGERMAIGGIALMTAALAVRAEIALLFPFLALAGPGVVRRSLWLAAALAAFFILQTIAVPALPGGAGSMLASVASYYDVRSLPRGVALLAIGAGLATCLGGALLVMRWPGAGRLDARKTLLLGALVVPSALAWLPNPQPVRHFWVLALGLALFLAWRLAPRIANARALWLVAGALVVGNQLLAEATYPLLVRHYDWAHPASEARRSVYWAPLGSFVFDAPARRREQEALYREAIEVVRAAREAPRLLVLAHNDRYLVARFIAEDPGLTPRVVESGGVSYQELASPRRRIAIARLWDRKPREAALSILEGGAFAGWAVYAQPASVGTLPAPALQRYQPLALPME